MKLSVVIPAFNRALLLPATLHSLLDQTLQADEIIVVDDGSTDDTPLIAKGFAPIVRVVRQANMGPAAARNRGLAESNGDFVHFFDSDDLALPNKHEVQVRALVETGADIALAPMLKAKIGKTFLTPENHVFQQKGLPHGDLTKALLTSWSIVPQTCLFRRATVINAGGFPDELVIAEDQLMFLRCLLVGAKVVHTPETLVLYRSDNSDKLTAKPSEHARRFRDWARFLVLAQRLCCEHGIDPSNWFGFRRRAWEAACDLRLLPGPSSESLIRQLEAIYGASSAILPFTIARLFHRWLGGFQVRLSGARAHRVFRTGRLSVLQEQMLQQMGLILRQ